MRLQLAIYGSWRDHILYVDERTPANIKSKVCYELVINDG